jgi:DNA-binding response OmpR family regulator
MANCPCCATSVASAYSHVMGSTIGPPDVAGNDDAGSEKSGPRVVVVEDEATILELLRTGLTYEGYQVAVAENGRHGLARAAKGVDLVVLDVMLPDMDGFEVCRRLRAQGSTAPVIMLTARGDVRSRVDGLDAGADDYLTKPFAFDELLARMRALLRRSGKDSADEVLRAADLTLSPATRDAWCGARRLDLTPIEFALLETLMRHPRRVFTRETLIRRIWGYNFAGDANVVEVHISHLRRKIGPSANRLIRTDRGLGYSLRPDNA